MIKFNKLPKRMKAVLIVFLAIAIVFLLILTKPKPSTQQSAEKTWQVSVVDIQKKTISPQIELFARIESPKLTKLSTTLAADVASLSALAGQTVRKDDPLLVLDDLDATLALRQAEANVSELEAKIASEHNRHKADLEALVAEQRMLQIAEDALARQSKLRASQLVAEERKETAEATAATNQLKVTLRQQSISDHPSRLAQLQASLKRARAQLAIAKRDLDKTVIKAPFDGKVTEVYVAPGARVTPNQALVEMYDNSALELKVQLPSRIANIVDSALQNGLEINGSANGDVLKLMRVAGNTSQRHGGRDAWFQPLATEHKFALNQSLKVVINLPAESGLVSLPIPSIYGTNRVYKVEDERLVPVEVSVIASEFIEGEKDRVLVRSASLNTGDRVITTQLPKAIHGLKVSIKEAD